MKITLSNDFHNAEVTLNVKDNRNISASQVKRAKRVLCGISGCTCSNDLGQRGDQDLPEGMEIITTMERDGSITARINA